MHKACVTKFALLSELSNILIVAHVINLAIPFREIDLALSFS